MLKSEKGWMVMVPHLSAAPVLGSRPTSRSPLDADSGRLRELLRQPEAIEYGENFIVHREGPEATPYLPNVIVSTQPLRPSGRLRHSDHGATSATTSARSRNIKLSWSEMKTSQQPAVGEGLPVLLRHPQDAPPGALANGR